VFHADPLQASYGASETPLFVLREPTARLGTSRCLSLFLAAELAFPAGCCTETAICLLPRRAAARAAISASQSRIAAPKRGGAGALRATVNLRARGGAGGGRAFGLPPRLHGAGPRPPMGRAARGSRGRPARRGVGVMASAGSGGSGAAEETEPPGGEGVEPAGAGGSESGSCATSLSGSSE